MFIADVKRRKLESSSSSKVSIQVSQHHWQGKAACSLLIAGRLGGIVVYRGNPSPMLLCNCLRTSPRATETTPLPAWCPFTRVVFLLADLSNLFIFLAVRVGLVILNARLSCLLFRLWVPEDVCFVSANLLNSSRRILKNKLNVILSESGKIQKGSIQKTLELQDVEDSVPGSSCHSLNVPNFI